MAAKLSSKEHAELKRLRIRANRAQGGLCYWCKQPMSDSAAESDPLKCTGDHVIPLHRGGKTIAGNIVAACHTCNTTRHPELSTMGGGLVASAGDDAPRSPFEVLRQ